MMKTKMMVLAAALLMLLTLLTAGCQRHAQQLPEEVAAVGNAVYYWRTELRLDSVERAFLSRHRVRRIYCRYFDVVMRDSVPMPNATVTFADTLPDSIELVPTVYITEECMHSRHEGLAEKLVSRICQMNETNDIKGVREIQIDCDYTARSRQTYYDFLKDVEREISLLTPHSSFLISTTIRLHQLRMAVPPVDYGVLMIYNTGDPRRFMDRRSADGRLLEEGRNPILDMRDVKPYLRHLSGYPLPLCAAYPVYRWQRNIHGVRVEHTVEAGEILRVKEAVEQERPELRQTILTYHLDKENINRYNTETYEKIYSH